MENRSHALAAGIFTILLGICAAVAIWWLGQSDESTTSYVLETRRNVTGLNVQAQVRYRGIRAGKVTAIEPDEADPRVILVRINIDSRFKLTKGSTAQLGYQGVTGLAYVQIEDDGSSAEPLAGKDGEPARIALKPTLFDTLGEKAGDIVTQISAVSQRLKAAGRQERAESFAHLDNVATASEGLREMPAILAAMRRRCRRTTCASCTRFWRMSKRRWARRAADPRDARPGQVHGALSRRFEQLAGSVGNELSRETLPQRQRPDARTGDQLAATVAPAGRLESNPQMLIFGRGGGAGPGEAGFSAPANRGETK
jgi:phospholipid/cholesterol/gamma-HCH transport system substrate-binding protein